MTDPGLSNRLRQHSRRSGLMVGLSMAGAIAICVGGFVAIYALSLPWVSDFVPLQAQERTPTPEPIIAQAETSEGVEPVATSVLNAITGNQNQDAAPVVAPEETQAPEPTETPEAFEPTHQIRSDQAVNLRPQPSSQTAPDNQPLALQPSTPLQYLNEDQPTNDPSDAPRWMRFRTENGDEGWVRELDVVEVDGR